MPASIELLIKNWKTTSPGCVMVVGALLSMYLRYRAGQNWLPSEAELTALVGGIGLIYAKAHNVTGGDKSNGLTPNPIQEAQAQIDVAVAKAETPIVDAAAVAEIKGKMDDFGARVKAEMELLQNELQKAMGQQ